MHSNKYIASIQCLDSYTQLLYLSILEYVVLCKRVESEHSFLNFKSSPHTYYDVSILASKLIIIIRRSYY